LWYGLEVHTVQLPLQWATTTIFLDISASSQPHEMLINQPIGSTNSLLLTLVIFIWVCQQCEWIQQIFISAHAAIMNVHALAL
jgi:hypothetical protein